MDKQKADSLIQEYFPKIYGFAMKKAFSYEEAEDLCADILQEVYSSLRKVDEIANLDGYIWRISTYIYSKYVATKKRQQGISIDGMEIPYYEDYDSLFGPTEEDMARLRRELAFLTKSRREIVYLFYYENMSISHISQKLDMPEGTVKWHLNKARNEMKEGFSMERKIGTLGVSPVEAFSLDHDGYPGPDNLATEYYLKDRLSLNIVYSVYHKPRTLEEIAEELGITPVFMEEKVSWLEENGFLVRKPGGRFTTYVKFSPRTYSREAAEQKLKMQWEAAKLLAEEYAPSIREAIQDATAYVPGGNRELLEMAAVFYGISCKAGSIAQRDLSRYFIKTASGGNFIAMVELGAAPSDPEYQFQRDWGNYNTSGIMQRYSCKYPAVSSWSVDTKYCSRKGGWKNNLVTDFEYLYEWMNGTLTEDITTIEKFQRLRHRGYLVEEQVNIVIVQGTQESFFGKIPPLGEKRKEHFASHILEAAMMEAKSYPPQMQDLVIHQEANSFFGTATATMAMDYLYGNGTFQKLTESGKAASTLLMFSDILPPQVERDCKKKSF